MEMRYNTTIRRIQTYSEFVEYKTSRSPGYTSITLSDWDEYPVIPEDSEQRERLVRNLDFIYGGRNETVLCMTDMMNENNQLLIWGIHAKVK